MNKLYVAVFANIKDCSMITITNRYHNPFLKGTSQENNVYTHSTMTGDEVITKEEVDRIMKAGGTWELTTNGYNVIHYK